MNKSENHKKGPNPSATGKVMTVAGAIDPAEMGPTLPHEHVMSTYGAESARYPYYDVDKLFGTVLPYLKVVKELGLRTLVDCTAAYFGRHPEILRKISASSGLHILTNTGYYGAAGGMYIPEHAYEESVDQLAERWVREWQFSIDGTGVRPGFIKTAIEDGPLSEVDRKLIAAAGRTHLQTGLTIQTHAKDNWAGVQEILGILRAERVHPSAWIWVHAHQEPGAQRIAHAAQQGAWISFDKVSEETAQHILELVQEMQQRGFMRQVLLSHDGDSYFGEGESRPYHFLFTDFIPTLKQAGFSSQDVDQLIVDNPRRAFTVRVRRSE